MKYLFISVIMQMMSGHSVDSSQTSQVITGKEPCIAAIKAVTGEPARSYSNGVFAYIGADAHNERISYRVTCIPMGVSE